MDEENMLSASQEYWPRLNTSERQTQFTSEVYCHKPDLFQAFVVLEVFPDSFQSLNIISI